MNCTKCNAPVNEGELYCKTCGDQFAANEQRAKVNEAYANTKNVIVKQLKSPIFLIVAILFTVIFVGQIVSMFTGGIMGIIGGILPFIFMLIATIGLWKGYTVKDVTGAPKALRQASIYDAYTRVMHTITIVLLSIVAALAFVFTLIGGLAAGGAASSMGGDDAAGSIMGGGIVTAIVILVVFAIIITIVSIFKGIYAKRRAYFKLVAETAETGKYTAIKAPVVGSYVLGGFDVLSAIFPIVMAVSGKAIIDALFGDLLGQLGDLGGVVDMLMDTIIGGAIISGLSSLVSGGYMILSAVWMASVHKAEEANKALVLAECARLEEIETATKEAMFADEKKRRDAEAAERKAAQDKADKAQADMAAQQQMMMQMMMQQMMQQNGMAMNMQAQAAQAAQAAPAAEAAPVEEAPAAEEAPAETPAAE